MKHLSKYVTLNLLSVLGYIFIAFILIVVLYIFPEMKEYAYTSDKDFNAYAEIFILCGGVILIYALVEFLLLLFVFPIEFLIYKFRKIEPKVIKIPDKFSKIHLIALILGIFVSIMPLVISIFYIFLPI